MMWCRYQMERRGEEEKDERNICTREVTYKCRIRKRIYLDSQGFYTLKESQNKTKWNGRKRRGMMTTREVLVHAERESAETVWGVRDYPVWGIGAVDIPIIDIHHHRW